MLRRTAMPSFSGHVLGIVFQVIEKVKRWIFAAVIRAMHAAELPARKFENIFFIDFFLNVSVSISTPPSCGFLCPWHIVREALSLPRPQTLSSHHPSRCSVLAPSVSCHVRLSSWSRRGSWVSKRTVNFPGWRCRAINNPKHRHTA